MYSVAFCQWAWENDGCGDPFPDYYWLFWLSGMKHCTVFIHTVKTLIISSDIYKWEGLNLTSFVYGRWRLCHFRQNMEENLIAKRNVKALVQQYFGFSSKSNFSVKESFCLDKPTVVEFAEMYKGKLLNHLLLYSLKWPSAWLKCTEHLTIKIRRR